MLFCVTLEFSVVEQKIASFYCDPGVVEHKTSPFTVTLECPVVEHNIAPYTTESEWGRVVNTVQWFAQRQYLGQGAQWAAVDRTAVLINAP